MFNNDIKSFYNLYARNIEYLIIDEFQYAKEGGQKLKYLYDTYKIKIIISGSSALELTHQAVKYLVGRIFIFHLFPFSFREYISYRNASVYKNIYLDIKGRIDAYLYDNKKKQPPKISTDIIKKIYKYYREYVIFGGYPRVVLSKDREEKITVLKNIYNTYFLKEIRDILQINTEEELQKLIKALSIQAGSMVVYNELSGTTSLNYGKLVEHLNILEKTFVIRKVLPFYSNKRVEIAKSPKIYFLDNGFRNIIINNFQMIDERVDRGSLNENFVAGQLLKSEYNIKYWRTKSNAEVDFVLEKDALNIAVEVKSSLSLNKTGRGLLSFREKYSPHRVVILSENYYYFDKSKDILFMPIFFI